MGQREARWALFIAGSAVDAAGCYYDPQEDAVCFRKGRPFSFFARRRVLMNADDTTALLLRQGFDEPGIEACVQRIIEMSEEA